MEQMIENIDVNKLVFDSNNPRVPLELRGVNDEGKIIEYMIKSGNIIELMESIATNGYFNAEPLLVVEQENGFYKVVEGNRRLAALKLINNPELATLRKKPINEVVANMDKRVPVKVPCLIYRNESEILDYLGFRHITGVKDWGALEKARYLNQLYVQHVEDTGENQIYTKLAKMIGSRTEYVRRLHTALKLYDLANDKAYFQLNIKESDVDFSWITTALSFKSITDYLGFSDKYLSMAELNEDHFGRVFKWMFDPSKKVVGESRQISQLAKVLSSGQAEKKLEMGAKLTEAILYTTQPNEYFIELLQKAKDNMVDAKSSVEQLNRVPDETEQILIDIEKFCKSIRGSIKELFHEDE